MTNSLPKLLITGGNGQLAQALKRHALAAQFQLHAVSHAEMDITDADAIQKTIAHYQPDWVINTAAYTAVDKAEAERELAIEVNQLGAQQLAMACQQQRIPLLHLSTDYIFDGKQLKPYQENEPANPVNLYGLSKWLGEEAVRKHCEQALILRVSGVISEYGNNFLKTMLRLATEKTVLRVVHDQITCPTYAGDIAAAVFAMVNQPLQTGVYHYCSAEAVSWHQFATAIIEEIKKNRPVTVLDIEAITTADYPTAAKRPAYSVLDCSKIARDYGITQPSLKKATQTIVANLTHSQE